MGTMMAVAPVVTDVDTGEWVDHIICDCDPDTALCGEDVSNDPWNPRGRPKVRCSLCRYGDDEHLPCTNPHCPHNSIPCRVRGCPYYEGV